MLDRAILGPIDVRSAPSASSDGACVAVLIVRRHRLIERRDPRMP
jgi:hypothetical protein